MRTDEDSQAVRGEVIERSEQQTAIEAVNRSSLSVMMEKADHRPRSLRNFKARAIDFATMDEETAGSCFYSLPARKGGDGKRIEGPSARLAEIVATTYGNIIADADVVAESDKFVIAQGFCMDLETNYAVRIRVRRRITDKHGSRYSDDMVATTGNAACSIALRNAVFKVVPQALVQPVFQAAREAAVGNAKTLTHKRAVAMDYTRKMGVDDERVFAALEVAGVEDIGQDQLATLRGLITAIKENDTSIDEAFPEPQKTQPQQGQWGFEQPSPQPDPQAVAEAEAQRQQLRQAAEETEQTETPAREPQPPVPDHPTLIDQLAQTHGVDQSTAMKALQQHSNQHYTKPFSKLNQAERQAVEREITEGKVQP